MTDEPAGARRACGRLSYFPGQPGADPSRRWLRAQEPSLFFLIFLHLHGGAPSQARHFPGERH